MRFLVDNSLSPAILETFTALGHEATHVRDLGMAAAPDREIVAKDVELNAVLDDAGIRIHRLA